MAATLSDGEEVSSEDTTATMKVTTDSSEGTLYAAARKGDAYQEGDGAAIKNGTGADWSGSIVGPQVGENTFNLTGLTDDIDNYQCGIVHETPPDHITFRHAFDSASMGVFYPVRASAGWEWDESAALREVANDVPLFSGGSWDGSSFGAAASCRGLLISPSFTNTLDYNGGGPNHYRDYWTYPGIDVTESRVGEASFCKAQFTTSSPAEAFMTRGNDSAVYEGPWAYTCYVVEGTSPSFGVAFSGNGRGEANYAWVGGVPVLQNTTDGAISWAVQVSPTIWQIAYIVPSVTNRWKAVQFGPVAFDQSPVSGYGTWVFGGEVVDSIRPGCMPVPMATSGTTTVATNWAWGALSDMGLPNLDGDLSCQYKFDPRQNNAGLTGTAYLFSLFGDSNNYVRAKYDSSSAALKLEVCATGSSQTMTAQSTFVEGENDLKFRCDSATGEVTIWFNGSQTYKQTGKTGAFGTALTHLFMGSGDNLDPTDSVAPHVLTDFSIANGALSDGDILGWD